MGYVEEALADNPVGYWRGEETEGTTAADSSGEGNTGTLVNTPTLGQAGAIPSEASNNAVKFTAAQSERITVPDAAELRVGSTFSVEFWIRIPEGASPSNWGVICKGTEELAVRIDSEGAGEWYVALLNRNKAEIGFSDNQISDGEWHHVVVTHTTKEIVVFIDGVDVTFEGFQAPATMKTGTATLVLGASQPTGEYQDGELDEIALYDTALSAERVAAHYEAATGEVVPDLPEVSTGEATGIEATKATLHGTVNPNGAPTTFSFLYGIPTPLGFEGGDLDGFNTGGEGEGSITVTEEWASEGSRSAKAVLESGQERAELTLGGDGGASFTPIQLKEGQQFSIEIDYLVPVGEMRYGAPGAHNVIFQLFPADAPEDVPMFNLNLWDHEGDKGLWVGAEDPETGTKYERFVGAFPEGKTVRIKLDLRISESKEGHQRVWIDGEKVLDEEGVSTVRPETSYGYCKLGLYRDAEDIEGESTIFIDRVVFIGLTEASYGNATEPASAGEGTEPVEVEAVVEGLTPGAGYHFRATAENGGGLARGDDATFTTEAAPDVEAPRRLTLLGAGR